MSASLFETCKNLQGSRNHQLPPKLLNREQLKVSEMCDPLFSQHHPLLTLQDATLSTTLFSIFVRQKQPKCHNFFDLIDLRRRLLGFQALFPLKRFTFCQSNLLTWRHFPSATTDLRWIQLTGRPLSICMSEPLILNACIRDYIKRRPSMHPALIPEGVC